MAIRTRSSTVNYLFGDHPSLVLGTSLGGTNMIADANGNNPITILYYPWGTQRYTSGTPPTTYRFTGQRYETALSLYYYGARWYDPYLNRWIQPDPIIFNKYNSTDWDRYSYARNNPTNYIDPTGNKPCDGNNTSPDQCNGITQEDLLQVLHTVYRWNVVGNWTKNELYKIIDTGNYIEQGIDLLTNGNGKGWMYSKMSNVTFVHTPQVDTALAFIGNKFNKGVPIDGITLNSTFVLIAQNGIVQYQLVHELGHVWDINSGNGNCPSTWCGGGPADELTVYAGGDPDGTRWTNGTSGMPQWSSDIHNGYGNHSTADYFAESFEWMLFYLVNLNHTSNLPNTDVLNWIISNASGGGQ